MASRREVSGFLTIKVKFDKDQPAYHVLYLKSHSVREEDEETPNGRTLFALNIPPYCTKLALKGLFGTCGQIQRICIQKQPGQVAKELQKRNSHFNSEDKLMGFKVAYIVFKKESSLQKALQLDTSVERILSSEENPIKTGIAKWCEEYTARYSNPTALQKEVDSFMRKFDKKVEEEKEEAKMLQTEADEDGWVTVGQGTRKPGAMKVSIAEIQEKKRKKKHKALLHFYNFQQRETRREHIAQLRKKFEEDKEKIAKMKAARKFRPY